MAAGFINLSTFFYGGLAPNRLYWKPHVAGKATSGDMMSRSLQHQFVDIKYSAMSAG